MIWLCSWQGYILVTSISLLSGNGDGFLPANFCMWSRIICLNQEIIEISLTPGLLRRTLYNCFVSQRRVKEELKMRYSVLGLVCVQNTTWSFCFCYSEKGLVSVFTVSFVCRPEQAPGITISLGSTPAEPHFVRVQRYFGNSGAVNCSRQWFWLKANMMERFTFSFILCVSPPYFSARSLNHSSLHGYTNSPSGLTTEVVQGWVLCKHQCKQFSLLCILSDLKYQNKRPCYEELYFFLLFSSAEHWVPTLHVYPH